MPDQPGAAERDAAERDPYMILGLSKDATEGEARDAFIVLARENHPALRPDDPDAAERYQEIVRAFSTLERRWSRRRSHRRPSGQGPNEAPVRSAPGTAPRSGRRRRRASRRSSGSAVVTRLFAIAVLTLLASVTFVIALVVM